jgi:hypothetical protein
MLHVHTALTYHLSSKIETGKGFKVDWNTFFRPFALQDFSDVVSLGEAGHKLDQIHLSRIVRVLGV